VAQADVSGVPKAEILEGILPSQRVFAQAGAVVIPEFTDDYDTNAPYGSTGIAMIGFHG